jgi:thioredoxin reductase/ferredoxin
MTAIMHLDIWIYLAPLAAIWGLFVGINKRNESRNRARQKEALEAGLAEPVSLHPVVNPNRCLGCGSCVNACPELSGSGQQVLGLINGKSTLIAPTHCIGHGACAAACPQEAITLVFGTARRGVEIPAVKPTFESNVKGLFIAGELGGMGLIRNAIIQGCEAIDSIRRVDGLGKGNQLDVLIVGAGPAGFAASLSAKEYNLRAKTIEQDTLGGTVAKFPRNKLVMTAPVKIPLVGKINFREISKEKLIDFWQKTEKKTGIRINYRERVEKISKNSQGFEVKTDRGCYQSRTVLLSLGRRGTPRKLAVPGEDLPKVVYQLIDPQQYRGRKVLVVGGGDSALEAAISIAGEPGTTVAISYRSDAFLRAKQYNRERAQQAGEQGQLQILLKSQVEEITATRVRLDHDGRKLELENDAVIVCAGGILPTGFLKECGVLVETKYGTR